MLTFPMASHTVLSPRSHSCLLLVVTQMQCLIYDCWLTISQNSLREKKVGECNYEKMERRWQLNQREFISTGNFRSSQRWMKQTKRGWSSILVEEYWRMWNKHYCNWKQTKDYLSCSLGTRWTEDHSFFGCAGLFCFSAFLIILP